MWPLQSPRCARGAVRPGPRRVWCPLRAASVRWSGLMLQWWVAARRASPSAPCCEAVRRHSVLLSSSPPRRTAISPRGLWLGPIATTPQPAAVRWRAYCRQEWSGSVGQSGASTRRRIRCIWAPSQPAARSATPVRVTPRASATTGWLCALVLSSTGEQSRGSLRRSAPTASARITTTRLRSTLPSWCGRCVRARAPSSPSRPVRSSVRGPRRRPCTSPPSTGNLAGYSHRCLWHSTRPHPQSLACPRLCQRSSRTSIDTARAPTLSTRCPKWTGHAA
mmetsp:Transcript_12092/g.39724  ORF Transcript_12092/g.39724 Transcript_12092/m.39724 type:complete len:278 (+) Transcript_12092:97-930(+)